MAKLSSFESYHEMIGETVIDGSKSNRESSVMKWGKEEEERVRLLGNEHDARIIGIVSQAIRIGVSL